MADAQQRGEVVIPHDPINEQVILAAALVDHDARKRLTKLYTPDQFQVDKHQAAWRGLQELERRQLVYDPATLKTIAADVDLAYIVSLEASRPDMPLNLEHHEALLKWDHVRATGARGPVAKLVEALHDPRKSPEDVRAYARQVGAAFDGFEDSKYLHDPHELVNSQMAVIEARSIGQAVYRYGLDCIDFYEASCNALDASGNPLATTPRLIPAAAPGLVTCITGVPGSGKTTFTARVALGLARQKRRILYGAWEVQPGMNLELMACMSLGWSRTKVTLGKLTTEEKATLKQRMLDISKYVQFVSNPFNRRDGRKAGRYDDPNDRNLDLVEQFIETTGADVFIADLWKRCLRRTDPDEEEHALTRQQDILSRHKCHGILVQQQRSKDIEGRPDKRPTREGIKGSGAWTEVPDTILGVHRPALWKSIPDVFLELCILKQRWAPWPLAIEVEWNADLGFFGNGRTIAYDQPGDAAQAAAENDPLLGSFMAPKIHTKKRKRSEA